MGFTLSTVFGFGFVVPFSAVQLPEFGVVARLEPFPLLDYCMVSSHGVFAEGVPTFVVFAKESMSWYRGVGVYSVDDETGDVNVGLESFEQLQAASDAFGAGEESFDWYVAVTSR